MIISIEGTLEHASTLSCAVNVHGVTYELFIPVNTSLPLLGEQVKLYTYAVYREDSQTLYGFSSLSARNFFKLIVEKVSGVGPRTAIVMLSKYSLSDIQQAILLKDAVSLSKIPGIGKKTAEKIILELSDQISADADASAVTVVSGLACASSAQMDAILGLITLGYKRSEAEQKIRALSASLPQATADVLIKAAIAVK